MDACSQMLMWPWCIVPSTGVPLHYSIRARGIIWPCPPPATLPYRLRVYHVNTCVHFRSLASPSMTAVTFEWPPRHYSINAAQLDASKAVLRSSLFASSIGRSIEPLNFALITMGRLFALDPIAIIRRWFCIISVLRSLGNHSGTCVMDAARPRRHWRLIAMDRCGYYVCT